MTRLHSAGQIDRRRRRERIDGRETAGRENCCPQNRTLAKIANI
jgi:hypothetical protein